MRRVLLGAGLASAVLALAACTDDSLSPVGDSLLPGGAVGGELDVVALAEFEIAIDYEIFPADRAEADRLVTALAWPGPGEFESRALFRFVVSELDSLPEDTEILDPRLELVFVSPREPVSFAVHRMTSSWSEEAATWERSELSTPWDAPGGDFDPLPVATFTIEGAAQDSIVADTISVPLPAELVADWVFGNVDNHGLIVVQETPGAGIEFVSRGVGGVNPSGPRLTFQFQLTEPGSPAAEVSLLAREDTFLATGGEPPPGELRVEAGAAVRRLILVPDFDVLLEGVSVVRAQLVLPVEGTSLPGDSLGLAAGRVVSDFRGEKTILAAPSGQDLFGFVIVRESELPVDSLVFESVFLTSAVRAWLRNPESNRGLYVLVANEPVAFGAVGFTGPGAVPGRRPHLRLVVAPPVEGGAGS